MYKLRRKTDPEWASYILEHFDTFLKDHAASERKAESTAMHFVVRYSDRPGLVEAMTELAIEELEHFRDVYAIMRDRGVDLGDDERDPYANQLLEIAHSGGEERLLDRLIVGSIAEYRGCERFALLARTMKEKKQLTEFVDFYEKLAAADSRHRQVYYDLAERYFPTDEVESRLDTFLEREAEIIRDLPVRAALH
jgi:tRNA-(ms[2]io[6]A)-hydroxylase